MHRAHFLDELIKSVPSERAHFHKRVNALEDRYDGPIVIHFKDSTTAIADAVIGADGVHSIIREHVLDKEKAKPVFAGSVAYRALVPMEKALERLDKEFAQNSFIICGKGTLSLYSHTSEKGEGKKRADEFQGKGSISYPTGGHMLNIVLFDFTVDTWDHDEWVLPADPEILRSKFSAWGASSKKLVEVSEGPPETKQINGRPY